MRSFEPGRHASVAVLPLLAVLTAGGCTLLVGAQLSDKPEGTGGAGGQDGGGSASASSASVSSTSVSSASSSGLVCPSGTANCDGMLPNGCEADLLNDKANCGACNHQCMQGEHCKDGSCN